MIKLKKYNRENILNKRITVIGLGISGKAVSILANQLGAIVYASDSNSSEEIISNAMDLMHDHHIATETGIHTKKIYDSDLWIVSPGVSAKSKIIKEAFNHNIPIVSEIEFSSWFTKFPIIGITGSNSFEILHHSYWFLGAFILNDFQTQKNPIDYKSFAFFSSSCNDGSFDIWIVECK